MFMSEKKFNCKIEPTKIGLPRFNKEDFEKLEKMAEETRESIERIKEFRRRLGLNDWK